MWHVSSQFRNGSGIIECACHLWQRVKGATRTERTFGTPSMAIVKKRTMRRSINIMVTRYGKWNVESTRF
jgi:hypothetical protein